MAAPGNLDMEALQTMMRAWVDELSTKQTENLTANLNELRRDQVQLKDKLNKNINKRTENLKEDLNNTISKMKQSIADSNKLLVKRIDDTNTRTVAVETTIETMLCEQTIIIESKKKQPFVIKDHNSSEIINTREEYKLSYLSDRNIQLAVQTHSKAIKTVTRWKNNICSENTHSKYRANVNYNDNNHNYNYKNYGDYYYKPRTKKRSAVYVGLKQTIATECDHYERKRGDSVWTRGRIKFSPYKQVSYAVTSGDRTAAVLQWNVNTRVRTMLNTATMLQRNNVFPVYDEQLLTKEGVN